MTLIHVRKLIVLTAVALLVFAGAVLVGAGLRGISPTDLVALGLAVVRRESLKHSTPERLAEIYARRPDVRELAASAGDSLRILVLKHERKVEVSAPGWTSPRVYPMTGFSGTLGPKLKEGDGQIPEGVYGIEYLNPNSLFHLSLKVSYPNDFDCRMAKKDGRTNLGGDIMIHGGSATVGCIPVGDEAIEELFAVAATVGVRNVSVLILPYDLRKGRQPSLESSAVDWYPRLLATLEVAVGIR